MTVQTADTEGTGTRSREGGVKTTTVVRRLWSSCDCNRGCDLRKERRNHRARFDLMRRSHELRRA